MISYAWGVDADGDWGAAADWSPSGPPSRGAAVAINTSHLHTVTYSSGDGSASVNSLDVGNDVFQLTGGALTITSAGSFAQSPADQRRDAGARGHRRGCGRRRLAWQ